MTEQLNTVFSTANTSNVTLNHAADLAQQRITDFFQITDANQLFTLFNGGQNEPTSAWLNATQALIESIRNNDYRLPIKLLGNGTLLGALGAFTTNGSDNAPVIYLNADYINTASAEAVVAVLLEEFGHSIDYAINGYNDTPGDEGHAFASLLLTSDAQLASNLVRNDHATLSIDGQAIAVEEDANLGIAQINYVPLPEADIQTALKSIAGATKVSGNIQTVVAITATDNNTVVTYDQWEDGYESNLNAPASASTKVWIYSSNQWYNDNNKNGIVDVGDTTLTTGSGITTNGQTLILSNAVDPTTPANVDFDGRDKIGSSKAISVVRAGWSATPGTVLAGAVSVIDAGNAGKSYILPIGQNVVTAATDVATSRLFEYTSVDIMATADNTTVNIDKDGNGTTDVTVVLNQGQTYMVNGGIYAGGKITADQAIGVNAIAGDVGSSYDNRWFSITPTEQWSNSYYAPVGTTLAADPATVFLYNPSTSSSITVYYDNATSTGNSITIPANTAKFVAMTGSAAHFYTRPVDGSPKFYAVSAIDSDATSHSTHDWSYSLVPESYLTTKFVAGWAPGVDNVTRSIAAGDANGSPVWVTTTADTFLYIDSKTVTVKNSAGTTISADPTFISGTTNRYSVKTLESYRLSDADKDQSGLTVYTQDGTLITGAWGEDPSIAGAGTPYLDMGYTVQPLPQYVFTKDSAEAPNGGNLAISNGDGILQLNEQIQYTLTIVNRSVIEMFRPTITDAWTPPGAVSYVAGSTKLTVYDTDGTTIINQFILPDGADSTLPLSGSGYTLADVDGNATNGITGLGRDQKIVVTYNLKLPNLTDTAQLAILAGNNYYIDNSAQLNDLAGTTQQSVNLTSITANITDGEVFLYDSAFTSVQTTYTPGNTIGLQVTDGDQNKNAGVAETFTVTVTNINTTEIETRTLTETGINTGIFRGSLPTSSGSSDGNNSGTLHLANGNTFKVEYTDPTTGTQFDNPDKPGINGNFTSGNANSKTAAVFTSLPPTTDGLVSFYFDAAYTLSNGNYQEGNSFYLQVNDGDQNFDAAAADALTVKVTNISTGEIENVTLTETGNNTGIFRGALTTSSNASDAGNNSGTLKTLAGNSVKVEYTDPITGASTDNPATPGANANTDTAAVAKIKTLYLSADAADNDTSGDLDRISPADTIPSDTSTQTTLAIGSTVTPNATPILTVTVPAATGSSQQISTASSATLAQTFKMPADQTTISKISLTLSDTASPSNTGLVVVKVVTATVSGSGTTLTIGSELGSATINASVLTTSASTQDFTFNLTGLNSSTTYAIVLENPSNGSIDWIRNTGNDTYGNGNAFDSGTVITAGGGG